MKLIPFVSVDDTPFTASPDDVLRRHGRPAEEGFNLVGLTEFDYGGVVFRFQSNGRLEEITVWADEIELDGNAVAWADLQAHVLAHDASAFRRAGFLVSPLFGLAFVPGDALADAPSDAPSDALGDALGVALGVGAPWVTALAAHCLDEWRALSP
ncbi:hypothetical protein AACH06_22870 [Ideonella sp. DXS29W]|uniref:Uncharacterized protein n=1 Tax=Ideonella lacteola TaxID=2984193 RepID=A0ABU9BV21_9BURK